MGQLLPMACAVPVCTVKVRARYCGHGGGGGPHPGSPVGRTGAMGLCSGGEGPIQAAQRCPGGSPFSKPRSSLHPLPPATPPGALGTPCPLAMSPRARNCANGVMWEVYMSKGAKKATTRKGAFSSTKERRSLLFKELQTEPWMEMGLGQLEPTAHL